MANIMVNDVCNLSCPYCFANKYVNGDNSTDISYINFKKAVDWINKSSDEAGEAQRVALIGGEPLLHHQFLDLLDYAVKNRRPNQEILVFSNGIRAKEYIEYFARNEISLLLNINSPLDIGEKRYKEVVNNIRLMREKGISASIGINLYKEDLDISFILDIIKEFSYKDLRVGLTSPNTKEKIEEGSRDYFLNIKPLFISIIKECAKLGCRVHLDCQKMPVCILEDDFELLNGIGKKYDVDIDIFECASCTPVIDILTDLKIVRCFGMSNKEFSYPMDAFDTEQEAIDFFRTQYDNLATFVPANDICKEKFCKEMHEGRCQGGCLSFKTEGLMELKNRLSNGNVSLKCSV